MTNIPIRIQDAEIGKLYKFLGSDLVIDIKKIDTDTDHVYGDIHNMNSPDTIFSNIGFWYNEMVVLYVNK